MNAEAIGQRIRLARQKRHMRQKDLAAKTGLTSNYICILEKGKKSPSLDTLVLICNALHISSDELLWEDLEVRYELRAGKVADRISQLSPEKQEEFYKLLDVMLRLP